MNEHELSASLRALHVERTQLPDPPELRQRVSALSFDDVPQKRSWLPLSPEWRFQTMFSATKFVLAGIVLALFGGVLAAGVFTQPSQDITPAALASAEASAEPTSAAEAEPDAAIEAPDARETTSGSTVITLPDELPEGVASGTIETPSGPARWVRMTNIAPNPDDLAAGHTIPAALTLVPLDDGVAAVGAWGVWKTSDGVNWEAVPIPIERPGPFHRHVLKRTGDTYVLVSERDGRNPFAIWTAQELDGDWQAVDVSAIDAAAPGAGWKSGEAHLAVEPVELADGRIGFSMSRQYSLPRQALGLPLARTRVMGRLTDRRYALCSQGKCAEGGAKAKWVVRFQETDAGLVVINHKTGERLGRIDGAVLSELYEGGTGLQIDSYAIEGDTVVPIEHPWPALDHLDTERPPWLGNILVFPPDGPEALFSSWDSRGTLRAGDSGVASIARTIPRSQAERTTLRLTEHPDLLTAELYESGSDWSSGNWESTDGLTWSERPDGLPVNAHVSHTGSAWLAQELNKKGNTNGKHWMHLGGGWVSVDELGATSSFDPVLKAGLGNVSVITSDPLRQEFDVWVITHPASD